MSKLMYGYDNVAVATNLTRYSLSKSVHPFSSSAVTYNHPHTYKANTIPSLQSGNNNKKMLVSAVLAAVLAPSLALDNGLALTPPMGWMSWLHFMCEVDCEKKPTKCLSEDLIKRTADRMVADGFKDAGYEYIIIDDCWLEKERENGKMVSDRKRFTGGMKALADYIHSKGLKFGMYEDIGTLTCAGYPGLKGHESVDVASFAGWDIDYLKVDGCYEESDESVMEKDYATFGKLLNESGRPILYSCSWPAYVGDKSNYTALAEHCNIWRNYDDISCDFDSILNIMDWFGNRSHLADFAGPGHFNDPDMLVVGNDCLTVDQARVQMAVWAVLAAPLLISMDMDEMKPEFKEILLNKDIIAANQCPLGKMGKRIFKKDNMEVWRRELHDGIAIAFVNTNNVTRVQEYGEKDLQLENVDYKVADYYKEDKDQIMSKADGRIVLRINPTGVKFYKFVPMIGEEIAVEVEDFHNDIYLSINGINTYLTN